MAETGITLWVVGLILIMLSNTSRTEYKTAYKGTGWKKYRLGYTIKEIKEIINLVDDEKIKTRLRRKIKFRSVGYLCMLLTPILIIIDNLINNGI